MNRSIARYMLGLVTIFSLASCGVADQPSTQASTPPAVSAPASPVAEASGAPKIGADDTLLIVRAEGGHCIAGACWSEKEIKANGTYHVSDGTGTQKDGKLSEPQIAELTQLIAAADFEQIKAQPFTGTCPIAFDGQELIYTFQTASGSEKIASCSVGINENDPLFQTIAGLIEVMNQP